GQTWSSLRELDTHPVVQPCGNGPMVRLPDGQLLVAFESYKAYEDRSPWSSRSCIVTSRDDGKTWDAPRVLAEDPQHFRFFWDQHVHCLHDGTLVDLCWSDDRRDLARSEIYAMTSADLGITWSVPKSTGISGQFSTLVELQDRRLALIYVTRVG